MSNLEKLDGLNRKISVSVPANEVKEAFSEAYSSIKKDAKVPGFRPGKVPISKIKTIYQDQIKQDVIQQLVNKSYGVALQEHEVTPLDYPKIDFDTIDEDKEFVFSATFEVRPEVTLNNYKGLGVEKEILNIDSKKVDEVLDNMQKYHAEETPVLEDRTAQNGDVAIIDFEGFTNNAPLENGSSKDFRLELGSNSFIPGFEEGIVGMKVGVEMDLNLNFPEEYHEKSIAGQPVKFKVKLTQLLTKKLPDLNDALAQKVDENFKTFDDLKKRITDDLTKDETNRIEADLKNRVLRSLVKENPVEVPQSLMVEQKKKLIEDTKNRLKQQGFSDSDWEEYHKKWDSDLNDTAAFMIQSSFLIDALSSELKFKAEEADFDKKFEELAANMDLEADKIKDFYKGDQKAQLAYQIVEEKVVKHLLDNAQIKELKADKLSD